MRRFDELVGRPLTPLPPQPEGVPWPIEAWPRADGPTPALDALVDEAFSRPAELGTTFAVVVVQGGRIVAERYGGELENWTGPNEPVTPATPLLSWSMAKSMLHAVVGMLVAEGRLGPLDAPVGLPEWSADARAQVTLEHLLAMRDGLDFTEDYVDDGVSDVIEMLFGSGAQDVAGYAVARPPLAPPGERFNYSSGTTNIVSRLVRDVVGAGGPYAEFLRARLFEPIAMRSAAARLDDAGTWIASSFVHATAHDFARFGLLYLRDGMWDGRRILPEGWVDHGRRLRSFDPADGRLYGAHWWVVGDDFGSFWAAGYEGQSIVVCPALDALLVRLGKTPAELGEHLPEWRSRVIAALA